MKRKQRRLNGTKWKETTEKKTEYFRIENGQLRIGSSTNSEGKDSLQRKQKIEREKEKMK